jgi:hypothetical protein
VLAGFKKKKSKIKIKIEKTSVGQLLTFDLIIKPKQKYRQNNFLILENQIMNNPPKKKFHIDNLIDN